MEMNVSEDAAVMPPDATSTEIPYVVTWVALGAICHVPYKDKKDLVGLELNGELMTLSMKDWQLAARIHDEIANSRAGIMMSGYEIMLWHQMAAKLVKKYTSEVDKSVVMLKDKGGAGYWRMILPAKHLEGTSEGTLRVDISASEVKFDYLLEYDTVYVQRVHDWESFYVLEKLKKAGKRIVYDIDDDIFSLKPDNPAFHVIGRDHQMAAAACMRMADCVTTTTDVLARRLAQVMDNGVTPVVIPNALDPDDRWLPTDQTGSPDGYKRIFWQGSATHGEDWGVCIGAIDEIMKKHDDVRLVILGFLPPLIQDRVGWPQYKDRIEFVGFSTAESYFEMIHHVRAEVGIAPLRPTTFNESKSPIKFLEYSVIGMPTVASKGHPYCDVIEDGVNGRLASVVDSREWFEAIDAYLMDDELRQTTVEAARTTVREQFDVKRVVDQWKHVLAL
jgi:glycosyltransferase involved in cell wall biosynthesis